MTFPKEYDEAIAQDRLRKEAIASISTLPESVLDVIGYGFGQMHNPAESIRNYLIESTNELYRL